MIRLGCEVTAVLAGTLLVLAACGKLGAPRSALAAPLAALGVPARYASILPVPLGLAEVAAAAAILFERGFVAAASVTVLATLFLAAGLVSLGKGLDVPCRCLGSDRGRLGWHQVASFPLWLTVAGLPLLSRGFASAGGADRWWAFLAVVTLVSAVLCYRLAGPVLAARELRMAIGPIR